MCSVYDGIDIVVALVMSLVFVIMLIMSLIFCSNVKILMSQIFVFLIFVCTVMLAIFVVVL